MVPLSILFFENWNDFAIEIFESSNIRIILKDYAKLIQYVKSDYKTWSEFLHKLIFKQVYILYCSQVQNIKASLRKERNIYYCGNQTCKQRFYQFNL